MRHEKIYHTCDRCGKKIEESKIPIFGIAKYPFTLTYKTLEERAHEVQKELMIVKKSMVVESAEIIMDYDHGNKKLELCGKCRKDFERFMKNE